MKLFSRTLFFFFSIILLQSLFTLFLVTNLINRSNLEDARNEMLKETALINNNFNAWKTGIWKDVVGIMRDDSISKISKTGRMEPLTAYLTGKFADSGYDVGTLMTTEKTILWKGSSDANKTLVNNLWKLVQPKNYPFITTVFYSNNLYLIGYIRLETGPNRWADVCIGKNIDYTLCRNLSSNPGSIILLFSGNKYVIGTPGKTLKDSESYPLALNKGYQEYFDYKIMDGRYNMIIRKMGDIRDEFRNSGLYLAVLLSNQFYINRLQTVMGYLFWVTLFGALFTVLVSLFFSRNITRPVKDLVFAMYRMKDGEYQEAKKAEHIYEIEELVTGFNTMAVKLNQNKAELDNYIHEIVFLKDYNEKIIHSIQSGIVIVNKNLSIEMVNRSFTDYFSISEKDILHKPVQFLPEEIVDENLIREIKTILDGGKQFSTRLKRHSGSLIFEIKLYPFSDAETGIYSCILVVEDISKRVEYEQKIFQAEKLSTISMLSAGVAHEINNPLESILTNIQNLKTEVKGEYQQNALVLVERETKRIARIVRKLLDFSSSDAVKKSGVDVNEIVREVIDLISLSIEKKKNIDFILELSAGLPFSGIVSDELKQILINLLKNSIQAIEGEGRIKLATEEAGDFVRVRISDSGAGIDESVLPMIFDPFFTTKPNGEGTGLGLSVVYGIIGKYGGFIQVNSKKGEGTDIVFTIPSESKLDGSVI